MNVYYLNILPLGSEALESCSLFPLLEMIIINFIVPYFQIHQFPVARLIFTISGWPVQSIVPCRILFCISVYLLETKKNTHEISYQKSQEAAKNPRFSYSNFLFFFFRNKKTE